MPIPPGPFRAGFFRSPLRGPWLTSVFAMALLVTVPVSFISGLMSYAAYDPRLAGNDMTPGAGLLHFYLFDWPTGPVWLYRLNQGLHITIGLVLVPLVLAKLWSVLPRLFTWPPFESPAHALERLSVFGLVASAVFELATGLVNIQYWYVFPDGFYEAHLYGAWVFTACFAIHVSLKFSTMRKALRSRRLRDELRVSTGDTLPEPADDTGLVAADPAPATMSRRTLIGTTAVGAALVGFMGAGQNIGGPLRRWAVLAPRSQVLGEGPNGFAVNKTAAYRGITTEATGDTWRLRLIGDTQVELSRSELLAMSQHSATLPIACVEGWSTGNQRWSGVRLGDLARLVGKARPTDLTVSSLQRNGAFGSSHWDAVAIGADNSLLALKVNGEDLSLDHGFPARIVVPASPGVRNTKWVNQMRFGSAS